MSDDFDPASLPASGVFVFKSQVPHLDIATKQALMEARVRRAHELQVAYGIDIAIMAEVMGLSLNNYLQRLRRLQLDGAVQSETERRTTDPALERLQMELKRLLDAEELPDKSKAEALMALARAVKTVNELSAESSVPAERTEEKAADVNETRQALLRIDRRIDELAKKRAREIMERGLDAKATDEGGGGMADPGA